MPSAALRTPGRGNRPGRPGAWGGLAEELVRAPVYHETQHEGMIGVLRPMAARPLTQTPPSVPRLFSDPETLLPRACQFRGPARIARGSSVPGATQRRGPTPGSRGLERRIRPPARARIFITSSVMFTLTMTLPDPPPRGYLRLADRHRDTAFSPAAAARTLGLSVRSARVALSRWTRSGWLLRAERGRYATADLDVRSMPEVEHALRPFASRCFYPVLYRAVG